MQIYYYHWHLFQQKQKISSNDFQEDEKPETRQQWKQQIYCFIAQWQGKMKFQDNVSTPQNQRVIKRGKEKLRKHPGTMRNCKPSYKTCAVMCEKMVWFMWGGVNSSVQLWVYIHVKWNQREKINKKKMISTSKNHFSHLRTFNY